VTWFEVIAGYVEALCGRLEPVADFGDRTVSDTAPNAAAWRSPKSARSVLYLNLLSTAIPG
jgi:hypothetical protein